MTTDLDTKLGHVLDEITATSITKAFGYVTVGELVLHVPARYRKRSALSAEVAPLEGETITVIGTIDSADTSYIAGRGKGRGRSLMLKLVVSDELRRWKVTFFNAYGLRNRLVPGVRVMLEGKVKIFQRQYSLTHPDFLVLDASSDSLDHSVGSAPGESTTASGALREIDLLESRLRHEGAPSLFDRSLLPVYRAQSPCTTWTVLYAIYETLNALGPITDSLDETLRTRTQVINLDLALRQVHQPHCEQDYLDGRRRLIFDEALALQTYLVGRKIVQTRLPAPQCQAISGGAHDIVLGSLPFDLTAGQRAVCAEIESDLAAPWPMNRLLQGDVGSGKTIVALMAMLRVVDSGRQCVLLAPTEVLAAQHHRSITVILGALAKQGVFSANSHPVRVTLLTGSLSTSSRRQSLLDTVSGEAAIIIGTHAVIQESVEFFDLGLVVVDEQHRFGVRQREHLQSKGRAGVVPHLLVMTATPIPRTVAMTLFGDLDVSTLREVPSGRQPVSSVVVDQRNQAWMDRMWDRVAEEAQAGNRTYVVCSRIGDGDETADSDPVSALDQAEDLAARLPELAIAVLHGRMAADEKEAAMAKFTRGEVDVLVSTTVIEVGVDVPEATVMIIRDADRFGVSQLHQLRGRIGRGSRPGLCLMVTGADPRSEAAQRIAEVAETTDGFALAELDLRSRREGDILGDAQSGTLRQLRLVSVVEHTDIISLAREVAIELLNADPTLKRFPAVRRWALLFARNDQGDESARIELDDCVFAGSASASLPGTKGPL